ncbi:MAG: aldehyde dehydrogenase family protein [Acidimicrobiia bacterium]
MNANTASLLLDGRRPAGEGEPFTVVDPATEEPLGQVQAASPGQVDRAAGRAFPAWRDAPQQERTEALLRLSEGIRELGLEGLWSFTATRHIHWNLDLQAKPGWFSEGEEEA